MYTVLMITENSKTNEPHKLFRAFICVDNIGTLVNKVFNLVISPFQRFIFIFSAMVSSGSNFTSS